MDLRNWMVSYNWWKNIWWLSESLKILTGLKMLVEEFYSIMQLTWIVSLVFIEEMAEIVQDCDIVVNHKKCYVFQIFVETV